MAVRFSNQLVAELYQPFWAALQAGEFLTDAATVAGTHRWRGLKWLREAGGVRPRRGRNLKGRCLTFAEREEIALGLAADESLRSIAARLGRSASTISREVARHSDAKGRYRATVAHALKIIKGGRYRNGPNSSPVPARNPTSSPGRYCIRLSRVFTSTVSSAMVCLVRFASDRFRCAQTGSTGFSSWA
jgi:Helix-turn-helix domain